MGSQGGQIRSILIIDDDREDFELVCEAVKKIDSDISVCYLGKWTDNLEQYRKMAFDLVLLDINMPYHDGFFWLNAIRRQGDHKLPVVIFSNSAYPGHITKAYEVGANLYFLKPESFDHLIRGLKKLIQLDWNDPFRISQTYSQNGAYSTFRFD